MKGVRFRADVGEEGEFEGICDYCAEWWPLSPEFWYPRSGLKRCRACTREASRVYNAERRKDPAIRAATNAMSLENRRAKKDIYEPVRRSWYARNRERLNQAKRDAYRAVREAAGGTVKGKPTDEERAIMHAQRKARDRAYHDAHRTARNAANRRRYHEKVLAEARRLGKDPTPLNEAERRRAQKRDHMRRVRAKARAA